MSFATLKFGEVCQRHPAANPRGLDARAVLLKPVEKIKLGKQEIPEPTWLLNKIAAEGSGSSVARAATTTTPAAPPLPRPASAQPDVRAQPQAQTQALQAPPAPQRASASAEGRRASAPPLAPTALRSQPLTAREPTPTHAATVAPHEVGFGPRRASSDVAAAAGAPAASARPAGTPVVSSRAPKLVADLRRPSAEEIDAIFKTIDFNGNGMLSLAELDKAVLELWPHFNNKPAIMRAYKASDANGSGFISKKEFHLFVLFIQVFDTAWKTFLTIDRDGDRRLTLQEFVKGAKLLSGFADKSEGELHTWFRGMDRNDGGFVLFDEFCDWYAAEAVAAERARLKISTKRGGPKKRSAAVDHFLELPSLAKTTSLFSRLDFNNNGMLSLAELDKGVVELWPQFNNKPALLRAYKATDANGNGFVSKKEFRAFLEYLIVYTNLFTRFTTMDTSGDRRLTEEEFVQGAPHLGLDGLGLETADLRALFRRIDRNGGGVLLFDEFCAYFASEALRNFRAGKGSDANRPPSPAVLPLGCHTCGRVISYDGWAAHVAACGEKLATEVQLLPSFLRRPVPAPPALPRITSDDVAKYNAEARRIYQEETLVTCPECRQSFKVAAFPAHFRTHPRLSIAREKELRRAHAAGPPPRAPPAHADPAAPVYDVAALCGALRVISPDDETLRALHRAVTLHALDPIEGAAVSQRQLLSWLQQLRFPNPEALRLGDVFGGGRRTQPTAEFQRCLRLPPKPTARQRQDALEEAALQGPPPPVLLPGTVGARPEGVELVARFVGGREEVFFVGGVAAPTMKRDVASLKRRLQASGYDVRDIQSVEIRQ